MNTSPNFANGTSAGNLMIVNEAVNRYPQVVEITRNDTNDVIYKSGAIPVGIKTKFLTFGIEAESLKTAKPRLERVETDILNNFKRLGVTAETLNGTERLKLLHDVLHIDEQRTFRFSWDWLAPTGLSVKDFIAPSSFEFKTGSTFGLGSKIGSVSFLQILAPELNDRMLADFLDMESSLIVNMHVHP
jgi:hypothetical protein